MSRKDAIAAQRQLRYNPKTATVMEMHEILDNLFIHLENTGSISNSDLMKMTTLSLIDDYRDEMISCNKNWKGVLDRLDKYFINTSCLFRAGNNY